MVKLNEAQLKQLAEFTSSLSILFFGTVVGPIFVPVEQVSLYMVILGLVIALGSLGMSMLLLRGNKL